MLKLGKIESFSKNEARRHDSWQVCLCLNISMHLLVSTWRLKMDHVKMCKDRKHCHSQMKWKGWSYCHSVTLCGCSECLSNDFSIERRMKCWWQEHSKCCDSDFFVGSRRFWMYVKYGSPLEDAWRVSTRWLHEICSLGMLGFWYMWNIVNISYFDNCSVKGRNNEYLSHLCGSAYSCVCAVLLVEDMLRTNSLFKVGVGLTSSWVVVSLLTCMQNVGALRMCWKCSARCLYTAWSLGLPCFKICHVWAW